MKIFLNILLILFTINIFADEPVQRYLKKYDDTANNLKVSNLTALSTVNMSGNDIINVTSILFNDGAQSIILDIDEIIRHRKKNDGMIPRPYPVFMLDMKEGWLDFEIKASTNNFETLVYYYRSHSLSVPGLDDHYTYTFHTDDYAEDIKKWVYTEPHESILLHLAAKGHGMADPEYIMFYPSRQCEFPADDWMWQENKNLVWSWTRYGANSAEKNASGRSKWHAIRPNSWEFERTRIPEMDEIEPPVPSDPRPEID